MHGLSYQPVRILSRVRVLLVEDGDEDVARIFRYDRG
jgi:hypothetical protein